VKVGDMVRWTAHDHWDNGGRGIVVDIGGDEIQVAWLDDIEDFGWDEVIGTKASWYGLEDIKEDIQLVVETL
jgi:hypothetical protein